jgi:hypothetical protein
LADDVMNPERAISGSFGRIFIDGQWQSNLNHIEAGVEPQKHEMNLAGDDWVSHKKGNKKGSGTMSGFKVTSGMIERGFARFSVISKLNDPEAFGHERIRLDNVMVDKIQLLNWTAGELVNEEIPFTFKGYELLDPIRAS